MTSSLRRPRAIDRGFSLIESMVASVVMLIGLLGLAGLQVTGMRANNLGKRMAQASLLARDLVQNMQVWDYADTRLTPQAGASPAHTGTYSDTNHADVAEFWDLRNTAALTSNVDGATVKFDYTDGAAGGALTSQLGANYEGVLSPVDTSLPAGEQTVYQRYWNVFLVDLTGSGTPQGKLVQVMVRWKEPNFGYRQVTTSFYKCDPSGFNL
ncbi:MAG TPA: prepilin-type N-terminal cleavage/methylation domain-containing protein [Myxococcales bacterium]|nr:prepilin-type N-terminal cleavage/methylation domain-containing protein [Myxococcales bacterium]